MYRPNTHFLDIPILFVIVMLGAMRPNTWTLFVTGTALALVAAAILTLVIPRLYPFEVGVVAGDTRCRITSSARKRGRGP